jgi:WD40 repeat protein
MTKYILAFMLIAMSSFNLLYAKYQEDAALCERSLIGSVTWRDTGTEFAIGSCSGIYRYDVATMTLIEHIEYHVRWHIAYQPGGNLLAFSTSNGLILWDLDASELYARLDGTDLLSWDETGARLAFSSPDYDLISVVDVETLDVIQTLEAPKDEIVSLAWDVGAAVRFGDNFDLYTWYIETGQLTRYSLPDDVRPTWNWWGDFSNDFWFDEAVFFRPGSFGYGELGFWRYKTGEWISAEMNDPDWIYAWSISAHPQDFIFALGTLSRVYIYDAETLEIIETYPTNDLNDVPMPTCTEDAPAEDQLYDIVAWHPDGESLLVVSPCRMAIIPMDE